MGIVYRSDLSVFLKIDWEDVNPLDVKPTNRARLSRFMLIAKLFQKSLLKEGQMLKFFVKSNVFLGNKLIKKTIY